jgi:glycosyltransferase involved in cell wall biosynthesis
VLGAGLPRLARWVFARQAAAAARLVAPSIHVRALLVAGGVPEQRVRVVPNGVDVAAHERAARPRGAPRDGRITLVFAGSFQPWHRVELLVSAFAMAAQRNELDLLLLGEGPGRASALAEVERLGLSDRVSAPGAVFASLLPEVLGICDVSVLPHTNAYGHPMKLLEYAAAGLPAVAPDLPTVREVVEDGVTGILFAPGDAHALAAAIERLAGDTELRTRMGRDARDRCLRASSWSERARRLIDGFGATEPERGGHPPVAARRGSPLGRSAVAAAS